MKYLRLLLLLSVSMFFACGSDVDSNGTGTGSHQAGLRAPGLTPVPCDPGFSSPIWSGSPTQLLVADAWAECVLQPVTVEGQFFGPWGFLFEAFVDDYLQVVAAHMALATSYFEKDLDHDDDQVPEVVRGPGILTDWHDLRTGDPGGAYPDSSDNNLPGKNNCDPGSVAPAARKRVPLTVTNSVREAALLMNDFAHMYDLRSAGVNLCIAQRLRAISPGAAGGEALLLSHEDQRELAEVVRERAQIAMVQYGVLASGAAGGPAFTDLGRYALLRNWMAIPTGFNDDTTIIPEFWTVDRLEAMGSDFAAAVQLHVTASEEIMDLMARSRSARLQFHGVQTQSTRSDEQWGPGSWHQRLLSSAFGGDPLAVDELDAPWPHIQPLKTTWSGLAEGDPPVVTPLVDALEPWPSRDLVPYFSANVTEPEVSELYGFARRFNTLALHLDESVDQEGCWNIRQSNSAVVLYNETEKALRRYHCEHADSGCSTADPGDVDEHFLWKLARIRPSHADKLVALLSEVVGPRFAGEPGCSALGGAVRAKSDIPRDMLKLAPVPSSVPGQDVLGLRIDPEASFAPRGLQDVAPSFTGLVQTRLPVADEVIPGLQEEFQGLSNVQSPPFFGVVNMQGIADNNKRRLGAVTALTATRSLLISAIEAAPSVPDVPVGVSAGQRANLAAFLTHAPRILKVIDAAVGEQGVSFKPILLPGDVGGLPALVVEQFSGSYIWKLRVEAPSSDAFWSPAGSEMLVAFAIPDNALAGDILQAPRMQLYGQNINSVLLSGVFGALQRREGPPGTDKFIAETNSGCGLLGCLPVPPGTRRVTLAVWRASLAEVQGLLGVGGQPTPVIDPADIRFLANRVDLFLPQFNAGGQYLAFGGALGDKLRKQTEPDSFNPTRHKYDGFGLPESWVPPFNAELLGGSSEESSVQFYLASARSTAEEATVAVNRAIDGLLERLKAEADVAAQTARSQQAIEEAVQRACGANATSCNVSTRLTTLEPLKTQLYPSLDAADLSVNAATGRPVICNNLPLDFPMPRENSPPASIETPLGPMVLPFADLGVDSNDTGLAKKMLDCFVKQRLVTFLRAETQLAQPVEVEIEREAVPAFAQFSGGELQTAFIEQWRALKSPNERFESLLKEQDASNSRIDVAAAIVKRQSKTIQLHCGVAAFARATAAGFSFGIPEGITWSPGPLLAQVTQCNQVLLDTDVVVKQETSTIKDAFSALANAAVGLTDAQAAIAASGATIERITGQSRLAQASAELEVALAASTQTTSFGLYRRYRDYDLWRAKALLENARRHGLAARRAIEARYAVDLAELTTPEAFVASPTSWADEVYEYDLSLPSAVGLAVGDPTPDGIYANKVSDYVTNLEGFVTGFAANRPTAVAREDIDVVTLPGLSRDIGTFIIDDAELNGVVTPLAVSTSQQSWMVLCPGETPAQSPAWRGVPMPEAGGVALACPPPASATECDTCQSVDACIAALRTNGRPCYSSPTRARLVFGLDPWGRHNDAIANEPFRKRYNGRWQRLAVNFVGTGIKDCTRAADVLGCYGEGFINYDMRHVGRPWLTDFGGAWRSLALPTGQIEAAKGLAAERWLDPLKDGWSTPYIGSIARTEFFLRPLGGSYEIEMEVGSEIILDRIERVQLLLGSTYWVVQD